VRRRTLLSFVIAATIAAAPVLAQAPGKVYRIGALWQAPAESAPGFRALRQRLREIGYIEGRNCVIEYRWAQDQPERLSALATELAHSKVDIIIASDVTTSRAAMRVTSDIPIVAAGNIGFATDLAHPIGNVTGLSNFAPEMTGKRLELLKEIVQGLTSVAVLWTPRNAIHSTLLREADEAAGQLGIRLLLVEAGSAGEIERAFGVAVAERVGAVMALQGPEYFHARELIAELGLKHQLPTTTGEDGFAQVGGLFKYGPSLTENNRRAAVYVDKILKGAKPADLPIEQPTRFELVINLKTANALGLTIPPSILARADEVIE
jgi:putative ABC transport system substrate-binding protein